MQRMHKLLKIRSTLFSPKLHYSSKKQTHYEALGVSQNATHNEIKVAFYELSLQYHPDKDASEGAKERFQAISSAYEILGNHGLRKKYDMHLKTTHGSVYTAEEQVFTVNNQNQPYTPLHKVYDFDAWHRQHYLNALERHAERKERYEAYMDYKRDTEHLDPLKSLIIASVIFTLIAIALFLHDFSLIHDRSLREKNKKPEDIVE